MKKRVLSLLLTMVMMVSLLPNAFAAKTATFTDVSKDMWCFDYVEFVADEGYFKGTTATTFNPAGPMTRQQFVTVLARMAGAKVDNSKTAFSDVPAGSYSAGSVAWAAANGIVTGYADGTFNPNAPVTRQQMCAFMSRFMDYYAEENDVYFLKKGTVSGFADQAQIADYAVDAVDRCRTYGLILGYAEDNTFRPAASATRAHVAAVIYRLAMIIEQAAGESGGARYTYTLTFTSNGDEVKTYSQPSNAATYTFEITDAEIVSPVDANGDVFLNWTDGETTYAAEDGVLTVEMTSDKRSMTLDAVWADPADLLYIAMNKAAVEANELAAAKAEKMANEYADAAASIALEPTTGDMADRQVNMTASAELKLTQATVGTKKFNTTAVVDDLFDIATEYALELVQCATKGDLLDLVNATKADCYNMADEILKAMGVDNWWTGDSYKAKVESLAKALYEDIKAQAKPHASDLWQNFKVDGKAITTEVAVKNGNTTLFTVEGTTLKGVDSYKDAVVEVAKVAGAKLYSSLQKNCKDTFVYDFVGEKAPSATLKLVFTMSDAKIAYEGANQKISAINAPFSKTYNVTAKLELTQAEDILGYRFTNSENQVQLLVTDFMQAQYAESVNEVAKKAMTNTAVRKELVDKAYAVVLKKIPADVKGYVDTDELYDTVAAWVAYNMQTDNIYGDDFYLPFYYLWELGGEIGPDGKSVQRAKNAKLGIQAIKGGKSLLNNEELNVYVDNLIVEVLADKYDVASNLALEPTMLKVIEKVIGGKVTAQMIEDETGLTVDWYNKHMNSAVKAVLLGVAEVEMENVLNTKTDIKKLVEDVPGAEEYLVNKALYMVGLKAFKPTKESAIIAALAAEAKADYGVDIDAITATLIGQYENYLNDLGLVKDFAGLKTVSVSKFAALLDNDTFVSVLENKAAGASAYLTKLGKAIAKIESNGSSVTFTLPNGTEVEVSNATLTDVKDAVKSGDVADLCDALAEFLGEFGTTSLSTFEQGVLVSVNVEAMGKQANGAVRVFLKVE